METRVSNVQQAQVLQVPNDNEVDIQVATAKRYPRNIRRALDEIQTVATINEKTAGECFYAVRKGGEVVEGVSVRLAEIIAMSWGNLRIQTGIIANDGKKITAQGICQDLEKNNIVSVQVQRCITNRDGKTYSDDMQVVTGNAASAIAFRNAVLKVIPKAVTSTIVEEIRRVAIGKSKDIETSRANVVEYFGKLGISKQQLLTYLKVKEIDDINADMIFELRGLANALKEGTTTLQETFSEVQNESEGIAAAARKKSEDSQAKAAAAMAAATEATPAKEEQKAAPAKTANKEKKEK